MFAAQLCYSQVTLVLIQEGADLNAVDVNGKTVLNYAKECPDPVIREDIVGLIQVFLENPKKISVIESRAKEYAIELKDANLFEVFKREAGLQDKIEQEPDSDEEEKDSTIKQVASKSKHRKKKKKNQKNTKTKDIPQQANTETLDELMESFQKVHLNQQEENSKGIVNSLLKIG